MIRYLIKNNIKMMIRSPFNIFIYVFGPTIVAAVLISAFNSLLESYDGVDTFEAGYIMEEGSQFESYIDELVENFEENDIRLIGFSEGDPEGLMKKNDLAGFVEFGKDDESVLDRSPGSGREGVRAHKTPHEVGTFLRDAFPASPRLYPR